MKRTETYSVTFFEATSAEWAGGSFIRELPYTLVQTSVDIGTHIESQQPHQYLEGALASDATVRSRI